jgi:hypothetical protein
MSTNRPSWATAPCPAWCEAEHDEDDHPDDREHESKHHDVPGVVRVDESAGTCQGEAATLDVVRHQHVGDHEQWVFVGDDRRWLDVSLETAMRLRDALTAVIGTR